MLARRWARHLTVAQLTHERGNHQPAEVGNDERAGRAADRSAGAHTGEGGDDGPCGDEGPHTRNRKHADPGQPTQRAANDGACSATGDGAFRRFRALLMAKLFRADVLREQH